MPDLSSLASSDLLHTHLALAGTRVFNDGSLLLLQLFLLLSLLLSVPLAYVCTFPE